ncbi:MAG: hypothetical protein K6G18_14130, partial [Treponema sp.]|nr:hypothetical protein [Treponema sp.]
PAAGSGPGRPQRLGRSAFRGAASEFTGSYTITFSNGTITVTFNGNSITLTNGSITASGTGTLVVQASSGSTGGSTGAGIPDPELHTMTAEEQAVYNSFLGTKYRFPGEDADKTYIFNADGTVINQHDDGRIYIGGLNGRGIIPGMITIGLNMKSPSMF